MTAPETVVEIAFDSGYSTGPAFYTWTDVSSYVELQDGITIGFGRSDELGIVDANSLSLTLDNTDGRFTPGLATSPYYPDVKIGRPIRVKSTPAGQATTTRFLGFIEDWAVEWGASQSYAKVTVSAVSRLARLGRSAALPSLFESQRRFDFYPSFDAYFALTESGLVTATASFTRPSTMLDAGPIDAAVVSFGAPAISPADGQPMAEFVDGGHYLTQSVEAVAFGADHGIGLIFATTATTGGIFGGFRAETIGSNTWWRSVTLELVAGRIVLRGQSQTDVGGLQSEVSITGPFVADGLPHSAIVNHEGAANTIELHVDGVLAGSASDELQVGFANGIYRAVIDGDIRIGSAYKAFTGEVPTFTGHVGRVMYDYGAKWFPDEIASYDGIFRTGFAEELPGVRLERLADFGQIPLAQVYANGSTPMSALDTLGKTAIALMREVETADGGVLFDSPSGVPTYQSRAVRYNAASVLTFDMDLEEVEPDYRPVLDRSVLVNEATATIADGTEHFHEDAASADDYGRQAKTETLATTSGAEGDAWASWNVNAYAEPALRVPTLTVELGPLSAAKQASTFTLTIGSRVTVANHPTQAAASSIDYFVEGYSESIGVGAHRLTLNVSPVAPFDNIFRLDHATLGELDSGNRLGR